MEVHIIKEDHGVIVLYEVFNSYELAIEYGKLVQKDFDSIKVSYLGKFKVNSSADIKY